MDNYITLEHLDQTVWSLIQKNNQLRDEISAVDEKVNNINITESDPIFSASPAAHITYNDMDYWDGAVRSSDLNSYMKKGIDYVTAGKKSGTSIGLYATAEGNSTTASGIDSHAEGNSTTASGIDSHAEGYSTIASGTCSHAEGDFTIATTRAQHVFGAYNTEDQGNPSRGWYVEIVGNGTSNTARSNARTLDWSGNEWLAGKLTVGAGPTDDMDVTTKQYVDAAAESNVFIATENITSYADTLTAYNAGKLIFAVINNATGNGKTILPLTRFSSSGFQFEGYYLTGLTHRPCVTLKSTGWTSTNTNGNVVTRTAVIAEGDYLLIRDLNDNNTIKSSTITFGTSTTQYLANNGTWVDIPTKTSQLTNDSGYITNAGVTSFNGSTGAITYTAPVTSVNGKTGAVTLTASDIGVDTSKFVASESQYVPPANLDYPTYYNTSSITHSQGRIVLQNNWFNDGVGQIESSIKLTMGTSIFAVQSSKTNIASIRVIADGTSYIHNLATPTADTDATNKAYVDNSIAAIDIPENTDELVKIERKTDVTGLKYILFGPDSGTTTIMSGSLNYMEADRALNASKGQKLFQLQPGELDLKDGNYYGRLVPSSNLTAARLYELPDASGTIALVSDITNALSGITSFNASVVTTLPTTDIDTHTIYFMSKTGSTNDVYDEYMYINNAWEKIGNTAVDLSGYLKTTDIAAWAKASTKPTYTADEVGAVPFNANSAVATLTGNVSTLRFQSASTTNQYIQAYVDPNNTSITLQSKYGSSYPITASVKLKGLATPQDATDATNKKYVDDKVAGITLPTKLSDLTNDAGYITSYTETDPVFAASAAAGITSTDISNWNAKVSDDKTWNGVTLDKTWSSGAATGYVCYVTSTDATSAKYYPVSSSSAPSANAIPKYDSAGHLRAYTPTVGDNSTQVATTAYVTTAIANAATTVTQTLTSGTAIATINGTTIYAPSYIDADGVSY